MRPFLTAAYLLIQTAAYLLTHMARHCRDPSQKMHLQHMAVNKEALRQRVTSLFKVRIYMCPHTNIYASSYYFIGVRMRYFRVTSLFKSLVSLPHTPIYVSEYSYIYVLILLHMPPICPHTTTYASSYAYICVRVLLYICPHTTTYASSCARNESRRSSRTSSVIYIYIYIFILIYICPHTTIYVSSYYYICVLMRY